MTDRLLPLAFENNEMPCGSCKKSTPHRLFGDMWRCSECGGVSSVCAQTAPPPPVSDSAELPKLLDELERRIRIDDSRHPTLYREEVTSPKLRSSREAVSQRFAELEGQIADANDRCKEYERERNEAGRRIAELEAELATVRTLNRENSARSRSRIAELESLLPTREEAEGLRWCLEEGDAKRYFTAAAYLVLVAKLSALRLLSEEKP